MRAPVSGVCRGDGFDYASEFRPRALAALAMRYAGIGHLVSQGVECQSTRVGRCVGSGKRSRLKHDPVLYQEALEFLSVRSGGIYVDCTVGLGGHSEGILERLQGSGQLIGLDRDAESLERARIYLGQRFDNFSLYHENYKNLASVLVTLGIQTIDGCLLDLGMSSYQLDTAERGFSFLQEAPLDMRMDRSQEQTAAQLVNELPEPQLAEIFRRYGEERSARKLAAAIITQRRRARLSTTKELADLVGRVKGRSRGARLHPATQVFQALRIAVNEELSALERFLPAGVQLLQPKGRLVVIAFHSLEDRIVKQTLQKEAGKCICRRPPDLCDCPRLERIGILSRKPVIPSEREVKRNPRARSAKLRAARRLSEPDVLLSQEDQ